MKRRYTHPSIVVLFLFAFCSDTTRDEPAGYRTVVAFPNLSFTRPVDLQQAREDTNHLFVVEQAGRIYVFENDASTGTANVFLDIRDRVDDGGNEEGLLGLAFHPDYSSTGWFFVNYTASDPDRTVVSRFTASVNDNQADPASEVVILSFPNPTATTTAVN